MDKNKAWEIFTATGRVQDYLAFKNLREDENTDTTEENYADKKNKNRRTDNKTTEYW